MTHAKVLLTAGQWLGSGFGDNLFTSIILELDAVDDALTGSIYAIDANSKIPSVFARLKLNQIESTQTVRVPLYALDPLSQRVVPSNEVTLRWPEGMISSSATIELKFVDDEVHAYWVSEHGLQGRATLLRSEAIDASEDPRHVNEISWRDYQDIVSALNYEDYVFRGQSGPWPLRTSFHRTKSNDLIAYFEDNIKEVRRQITPHIDATDFSGIEGEMSLLHLLQHYGYPTPLLDWSYSPFISAFFSYSPTTSNGRHVFVFDKKKWEQYFTPKYRVGFCEPHLSIIDALPVMNERSLPQQGLSMVTNIASVEAYITSQEDRFNSNFLTVYKLHESDRDQALTDMLRMGINAATIYPGLEGTCQAMKARHFGY